MASAPGELIGAAGRCYRFKELIQERPYLGRVWLATSEIPRHLYYPARELTLFQIGTGTICLEGYPQRHLLRLQR